MPRGVYQREVLTAICQNPICRMPFEARRGGQEARWCSDACKQAGYRLKKFRSEMAAKTGVPAKM